MYFPFKQGVGFKKYLQLLEYFSQYASFSHSFVMVGINDGIAA